MKDVRREKGKDAMSKWEKIVAASHRIKGGIWLTAVTCFMLFLYAPMELLFINQDEFWFDVYILVPPMLVVFGIGFLGGVLLFFLLRKRSEKLYGGVLAAGFAGLIGLYAQGNFLTAGLPPLDGETIDWSLYPVERIKSVLVWAAAVAIVGALFWKLKRRIFENAVKIVSIGMILMFCVTLTTLAVTEHGFSKKPSMSVTDAAMFQMSEDANFVILLLDAVDAQAFGSLIGTRPAYGEIFTDFTFYNNVVAAYPYTQHSIPYLLSGIWYENETAFREYEREAYASSPFLASVEEAGYRMGLYEAEVLPDDGGLERFENIMPNERGIGDRQAFVRWQLLMTGFKYAPYDLKRFSFVNPNAFNTLKITPEGETLFTPSNFSFYDGIRNQEISYTDEKCFRFIHIDGGHVPFIYNEKVEKIPEDAGSYEDNLRACLTITAAYLEKLKKGGVYDNSVIVVMADHGYNWLDPHGRQNPILFVKGVNEKHDFTVSDAPVSFEDMQQAFKRLLDGAESGSVFDWNSGDKRERRYLFHEYLKEDHMVEYMQPGQAHDTEAMYETGRVYDR